MPYLVIRIIGLELKEENLSYPICPLSIVKTLPNTKERVQSIAVAFE